MKRAQKAVSALMTVAMLGGIILPLGVAPADAATKNTTSSLKTVGTDFKGLLGSITIKEDGATKEDFEEGKVFTITLPDGVSFAKQTGADSWKDVDDVGVTDAVYGGATLDGKAWVEFSKDIEVAATFNSERSMTVKIVKDNKQAEGWIKINAYGIVDGTVGDIKVTIDPVDSGISGGDIILARTASGSMQGTVLNVPSIGEENGVDVGVVRLTESTPGAIEAGDEIKLKLPTGFEWVNSGTDKIKLSYVTGFAADSFDVYVTDGNKRELKLVYKKDQPKTSTRGIIEIKGKVNVDNEAKLGDVVVTVSGDNVDSNDLIVAKYGDYGVDISVKSTPEVVAGIQGEELGTIVIDETVDGSLTEGRKITLELPEFVKFDENPKVSTLSGPKVLKENQFTITDSDKRKAEVTIKRDGTKKAKFEIKLKKLNIKADAAGDITVKVTGSAIGTAKEVVVGKVVAPVKVSTVAKEIKLGMANQQAGDIIITEAKAGAIKDRNVDTLVKAYTPAGGGDQVHIDTNNDGTLTLSLPSFDGVKFSKTPKVEVTEGNLEIDSVVKSDKLITMKIKSSSTKASTIKVSDVYLTADRTVPVGDIKVNVGGIGIVQTYVGDDATKRDFGFDEDTVASVFPAKLINAAPSTGSVSFSIGSQIYTVDGVAKVMDASPYIKEGRTYVPVRYLALALGVSEDNIGFENGVVTLTKGDAVVKMTLGSKTITVNDQAQTMDVAPESNNGRTMLPARYVAEAFGAQVGFANGQVVISN